MVTLVILDDSIFNYIKNADQREHRRRGPGLQDHGDQGRAVAGPVMSSLTTLAAAEQVAGLAAGGWPVEDAY